MEYYSAAKRNEKIPFAATWRDLEMIIPSEGSQKKKDKHHVISLTRGIKNTTQMNLLTKQKTDSQREQTCGCQEGRRWCEGLSSWLVDTNYYT